MSRGRLKALSPRLWLACWTGIVVLFLYLPILLLAVGSVNKSTLNVAWQGFTLQWYAAVWHDRLLMTAIANSLIVAAATTAISVVLGTVAAWLLHRHRFPGIAAIRTLLVVPMIIPEVIMGVSLMLLFRSLSVDRGFFTLIVAHVTFCFPFVMAAVQARLAGLDPALEEAALDLGATPPVAFVRVIVPFLLPGIIAGALLAFTLSLDEFVVTYFTYSADSITLPVKIYGAMKVGVAPTLNAISTLFVVCTIILVLAAMGIAGTKETGDQKQ